MHADAHGLRIDGLARYDRACNKLLLALRQVASTYTLGLLATCIAADRRSQVLAGKLSKREDAPIHRTTLERWIEDIDSDPATPIPDEAVRAFRRKDYARQQIVFEFLERSPEIETCLYNPARELPVGFTAFLDAHGEALQHLRFDLLSNLDGVYQLYRCAWTTPERTDRVLVSRLVIETAADLTRYSEEQDYRDHALGNMPVQEIDHGIVFNSGTNLFLLGFGSGEFRVKFFAVHAWSPNIDGRRPVHVLKGTMIGAAGEGPHPGSRFIAYRTDEPEKLRSRVVPSSEISPEIRQWLGCTTPSDIPPFEQ